MNKLTIPTILVATVMVAGIFAFIPVEQASTVHTTAAGSSTDLLALTTTPLNAAATDTNTWTINSPFCVISISYIPTTGSAAGTALNYGVPTIATNLALAADNVMGDPGAIADDVTSGELLVANDADSPKVCGTTTLVLVTTVGTGDAADSALWTVLIETNGSVTAPASVITAA